MLPSPARLIEVEKFLDTVTICPAQLGQHAALWGLRNLDDWLAGERIEILARAQAMRDGFAPMAERGWKLMGCGAYFAYLQHPFDMPSDQLAQALVDKASLRALPGTMCTPEGDKRGTQQMRVAFANIDAAGIQTALTRLVAFQP
jgi:aspartate/methionine/tyrosine aminotransferase